MGMPISGVVSVHVGGLHMHVYWFSHTVLCGNHTVLLRSESLL